MNLGEIIRSLRATNGMTQKELADKLSISPSTIGMYEQGRREPDLDTISKIANIFNVTIGYLVGTEKSNETNLSDRIKTLRLSADMTQEDFHNLFFKEWPACRERIYARIKDLSISKEDFINNIGVNLENEISISDLITIATYLNISIDYLLGRESLNSIENKCLSIFRQLNEDNQDIIIGEMKKCIKEQRYEESVAAEESLKKTGTDNLGK